MIPFLGGEVHCTEFAPAGSVELANIAAAGLQEKKVCLLANHGVLPLAIRLRKLISGLNMLKTPPKFVNSP